VTDGSEASAIATIVERDGQPVVEVVGEVDLSTAGQVEQAIAEVAARGGRVVVDLSGVAFIDSSGVTALLRSAKGNDLLLRHPSPAVTEVLAMAGLADTLPIEG
jgi:anti-sigma B factor antagonist